MKHKVDFIHSNESFELEEGSYILESLQQLGVDLPFDCCSGFCGACLMQVEGDVTWASESHCLTQDEVDKGFILSCICKIKESIKVVE
ncbi:MAG: hypothetical protein COB02_02685 [Candidatus Cloacimonadota bacterium]|nr:MAG: hypothetical protein COB02_02685 [Candidatus Cloacimonadota bacterium]